MPQTSWDQVKRIFHDALERTRSERSQFVDAACGSDPELRAQVEELLTAHDESGRFLESPTVPDATDSAPAAIADGGPVKEGPGSIIGPYKLLQVIGEGGFGVVYMAEQEHPIRRRVALKIIKLGMDTKEVIARFEAERQALAMMEHPNIAKVFDADTTDSGRPYFVMELVKGVPITEYCDANRLNTRERLGLFIEVCHAVQHAHQKGIIHRDVKPSNVMVTLHDGRPVPKVIDFGVAKATAHRLTEKTLFTAYGQVIGTPAYMSPEQAEMSGLDIDTRSDIYSLGVLLYELLTGTTPFEKRALRSAAYFEVLRILREDEPPTPSRRLTTMGDPLTETARLRRTEPAALARLVRGDLDWIVLKALEKDRTRRYPSASEFAADVGRHLRDEPITARQPGPAYRLRKFVRKNRGAVAAVGLALVTLMLGTALATWQAVRASAEARRARANAILVTATASEDPLLKALLLDEVADIPELPGKLAVLREALNYPLPRWVIRLPDYPNATRYSPDGQYLAVSLVDGTARIWRTDGSDEPRILPHEDEVDYLGFSPDGQRLVTGTSAGIVRIWPVHIDGDPIVFNADKRIESADFSPDGVWLSAGTEQSGPIWIWPSDGSEGPTILQVDGVGLLGGDFFPDSKRVLTGGTDGIARVWHIEGEGEPLLFPGPDSGWVYAKMSPDGEWVAASGEGSVHIYPIDGNGQPFVLDHTGAISWTTRFNGEIAVTASRDSSVMIWSLDKPDQPTVLRLAAQSTAQIYGDGKRVYTTSDDGKLRVWRADGTGPVAIFAGPRGAMGAIESPDGRLVNAAFADRSLRTWSLGDDHGEHRILRHPDRVNGVSYSPDGQRIATAADDGLVRIWFADAPGPPAEFHGHHERVNSVAFSPDGKHLITASSDSTVRIWAVDGTEAPTILPHPDGVLDAAFHPKGALVVTGTVDGRVRLWNVSDPTTPVILTKHGDWESWSLEGDAAVASVSFNASGDRVLSTSLDHTAQVTTIDGSSPPVILRGNYEVMDGAFSPNGEHVVLKSDDARLVHADGSGTLVHLPPTETYGRSITIAGDGNRVLEGSNDGTARITWLDSTEDPIFLRGHTDVVRDVTFSPDGSRVATASWDGTVRIWRVTFPELLEYLRANLHVCLTPEQRVQYLAEAPSDAGVTADVCERRLRANRGLGQD